MNGIEINKKSFTHKSLRVIVIIQLCLIFTAVAYYAGYPFMGELYEIKSQKLLYESIIGRADPYNASLFKSLPESEQNRMIEGYERLKQWSQQSFSTKLQRSFHILLHIPPFEKAWIFFSTAISLLILFRVDGASTAAWLLPLIVIFFALDHAQNSINNFDRKEAAFFPTETKLIREHLKKPLSRNIFVQKKQLLQAWKRHLVQQWAQEIPSHNLETFEKQLQKGNFYFNVAKLKAVNSAKKNSDMTTIKKSLSSATCLLYLLWNLFFAWFVNRQALWYSRQDMIA